MKHLIIVFFLMPLLCHAQQRKVPDNKKIDFSRFWHHTFPLPNAHAVISAPINISGFRVIDARFDTATIGFMQRGVPDTRRKLKLTNGTVADIQSFLTASVAKTGNTTSGEAHEILCVIKKLWLSDGIYTREGIPSAKGENTVRLNVMSGIMLQMDFFASSHNEYVPLYQYDTTMVGAAGIFRQGGSYIATALAASLGKLSQFTNGRISSIKKRLSYRGIEEYYQARFAIPILSQTPLKGVYMSFEEFKNNQPSITAYRIVPNEKTDELYAIDKTGNETLLRDAFGFCNGSDIWVAGANNFFKLHRAHQTFNIYGAKSMRKSRMYFNANKFLPTGIDPEIRSKNSSFVIYRLTHHPYQLDMETGDFF
ncbi:MAG: hypothetical protein ACTHLE_09040 [Agriterribacter sp.]